METPAIAPHASEAVGATGLYVALHCPAGAFNTVSEGQVTNGGTLSKVKINAPLTVCTGTASKLLFKASKGAANKILVLASPIGSRTLKVMVMIGPPSGTFGQLGAPPKKARVPLGTSTKMGEGPALIF